jgi:Family of unknown function (DUF5681)
MVADNFLQKQQKQRGRPFEKGRSGNPAGRPRGNRNRSTLAAQLLLQGEAEALTRKAVELALNGDPTALRLCLDRLIAPHRERLVPLTLPPMRKPADLAATMEAITAAVGREGCWRRPRQPNWQKWSTPLPTPSRRAISTAGCARWRNGLDAAVSALNKVVSPKAIIAS